MGVFVAFLSVSRQRKDVLAHRSVTRRRLWRRGTGSVSDTKLCSNKGGMERGEGMGQSLPRGTRCFYKSVLYVVIVLFAACSRRKRTVRRHVLVQTNLTIFTDKKEYISPMVNHVLFKMKFNQGPTYKCVLLIIHLIEFLIKYTSDIGAIRRWR